MRHRLDVRVHQGLGALAHLRDDRADRPLPVLVEERGQALLADRQGAELRAHVAQALLRHPDVAHDDVDDVLDQLAPTHQVHGGKPQALLLDLGRGRAETAGHHPPVSDQWLVFERYVHSSPRQ